MHPILYIRYDLWPRLRVRGTYALLALRYGGKRKIPPEVIRRQLEKSIERMEQNLGNALRALPDDVGEDEKQQLLAAMSAAQQVKDTVEYMPER